MDRRDFLRYAAASSTFPILMGRGAAEETFDQQFEETDWSTWAKDGVSNLRISDGNGVLEAATNIYPSDKRAVVFRTDARAENAEIRSTITQQGVGPGVVLRRVEPDTYYAAVFERVEGSLKLLARIDGDEEVLNRLPVGAIGGDEIELSLRTLGTQPTQLEASLGPVDASETLRVNAPDSTERLQRPGDPGVLGTAETGFRAGPEWRTPIGTQSARAIWTTDNFEEGDDGGIRNSAIPVEAARQEVTEQTSTTTFSSIRYDSFDETFDETTPSTVEATTLRPRNSNGGPGALVSVVTDVTCHVLIEVSSGPSFDSSKIIDGGSVNEYNTAFVEVPAPKPSARFYWRPRLERGGQESVGPTRSVRALPPSSAPDEVSLAIGSCATQFGETFAHIADFDPDAFVWHGDLNYLDGSGPLAQTESGFAGMWKDFLGTDELRPILDRAYFATQRDDHDYGTNDVEAEDIPDYGIYPYEGIVNPDRYYRFGGGLVDVWVTETRRWREPVSKPDTPEKTLLGEEQLEWLLAGLRNSTAPFKLVCSPGPLFNVPNDSTSWAKGYTSERDHVLDVINRDIDGRTVFVTGDTHSGCVTRFQDEGLEFLEIRAAPLDIPSAGQHGASSGDNVVYSEQGKFYSTVSVRGEKQNAVMEIALRKGDGTIAWEDSLVVHR